MCEVAFYDFQGLKVSIQLLDYPKFTIYISHGDKQNDNFDSYFRKILKPIYRLFI